MRRNNFKILKRIRRPRVDLLLKTFCRVDSRTRFLFNLEKNNDNSVKMTSESANGCALYVRIRISDRHLCHLSIFTFCVRRTTTTKFYRFFLLDSSRTSHNYIVYRMFARKRKILARCENISKINNQTLAYFAPAWNVQSHFQIIICQHIPINGWNDTFKILVLHVKCAGICWSMSGTRFVFQLSFHSVRDEKV